MHAVGKAGKPGRLSRFVNKNKTAYLFLAPWLVGVAVFILYPMICSLYLSFTNYSFGQHATFVGLRNYIGMFTDDRRYLACLKVTFRYVFLAVPVRLLVSLGIALLLNKGLRGLGIYRALYYVPSLLGGSIAISLLWTQVFGAQGLLNGVLTRLGVEGAAGVSWITEPKTALYTLIVLLIWQFGSSMIIFLAGIKQVPATLYESAAIDGAGAVKSFFKITLPLLTPILLFNLVMEIINAFQAFTPAFIISNGTGGALDSILFYTLYLYIKGFNQFQMGYASAMAWVLLLVIGAFTALVLLSAKKWVHYEK